MVTLYTTHCPQCKVLEAKLNQKSIQYETCEDQSTMHALGFRAAPMLGVDGTYLNFAEAIRWVNSQK